MSNTSPVATVFVDFKSPFDRLQFWGCLEKLLRTWIPKSNVNWIRARRINLKGTILICGKRSGWFEMLRGGPQGSSFTWKLFKTYHTDMEDFIAMAMSFFFCWRSCCCNSCSNWNSFRWSIYRFRTSITFFFGVSRILWYTVRSTNQLCEDECNVFS